VKRSVGIDINSNCVRIVQLSCGRGRYFLERSYIHQLPEGTFANNISAENIKTAIRNAITKGNIDAKSPVTVAMPFGKVFFRNFRTDISNDSQVRQILKFEMEDDFPIPFEDLVVDICSCRQLEGQERNILVGAVSRSALQEMTGKMQTAGIHCAIVTADVCSLQTITKLSRIDCNAPSLVVYTGVGRTIITVFEKNNLIAVRCISINETTDNVTSQLRQEIGLTLRVAFTAGIPELSKILLCGCESTVNTLFEELPKVFNCEAVILNPFAQFKNSSRSQADGELVIALGLALAGADVKSNVLNFSAADKAAAERTAKTRKNALVLGFLLFVLAALAMVNLFVRLNILENQNRQINEQLRDVFTQNFPEEKNIVNESAQMAEKYNLLKEQYNVLASEVLNKISPLSVLQHISEKITPAMNVSVSGISMTAEQVLLSGIADSSDAVDNVVETLKQVPEFRSVEIRNVDWDPVNNKWPFTVLIKTGLN
jgi:Tfp pilus assembly PilM family ATPase/Tfp pilus assembly protein PilN